MSTIGRMLTRMILARFAVIVLGITLLVITLDVLANMDGILDKGGGAQVALLKYAALRFPSMLATFWIMSLLLAVVLTFIELGYRNEIVPIWAAGVSPGRVMLMLLPLGLLMAATHFALVDRIVPETTRALRAWGVGEYAARKMHGGDGAAVWMRAGRDILRAGQANEAADRLRDVIIFRRDARGLLVEQVFAREARREQGRWLMHDVVIYHADGTPPVRLPALVHAGELKLAATGLRLGDPEEMTLFDLKYFVDNLGFGLRPVQVYESWWHRRLATPLGVLFIMLVMVPLAARFRRGSIAAPLLVGGVAVGFGYFVFEGLALTIGELGLVPAWLAGWTPTALLAMLAVALLLRAETVQ